MKDYTLVLGRAAEEPRETIRFKAIDAAGALALAHRHNHIGMAELWENGRKLCRLDYAPRGFWIVTPARDEVPPQER